MKKTQKPDQPRWRNRIVGHGEESPEQLLANPSNWRVHPQFQGKALTGVLDQVGWVDSVIVNKITGFVVDGHLRVANAISEGATTVPVTYVELTAEEEAIVLATFDPITNLAVTDQEMYTKLAAEAQVEDAATRAMMNDIMLGNPGSTPDLDNLGNTHGDHDDSVFWPVLRVQINPESQARFNAIKKAWQMEDDATVIMEMISRVHGDL